MVISARFNSNVSFNTPDTLLDWLSCLSEHSYRYGSCSIVHLQDRAFQRALDEASRCFYCWDMSIMQIQDLPDSGWSTYRIHNKHDSTHLGTNREVILKFHGGTSKTLGGVGCQSFDEIKITRTRNSLNSWSYFNQPVSILKGFFLVKIRGCFDVGQGKLLVIFKFEI